MASIWIALVTARLDTSLDLRDKTGTIGRGNRQSTLYFEVLLATRQATELEKMRTGEEMK